MPITVKHTKVSTIPDDADTSLVRPSDWNADHTLVGLGTMAEQNANAVAITGGTATLTSVSTPIVQATNSAGLALRNSAGTTQISMGGGGGDNVTIAVATNINGANAQIDISPTGTGHVHIKPTGSGSLEIAPTNVGTIDNMTIGATTARNASVVDLSVTGTTSFDGSQGTAGQVLTSAGAGNTPTWATPTTGTVTSITAGTGLSGGTITTTGTIAIDSTVTTNSGTQTLTNKRVTPRTASNGATTSGNITPTGDTADQYNITGLTGTSAIQIPSGTPTNAQKLSIRIKDDGTGRTLSWVTTAGGYRVIGTTLPLTTTANKTIYVGCVYNNADSFWDVVAVASEV
jgi:hypothetical protein